jgi:AcrR family transcriptional regulator
MARSYRLGKRGEAVTASRARIVRAARELLRRKDYQGLSVESVAEVAGVSRATVYNQFESKSGIVQALFDDIGRRIEFDRVRAALRDPDVFRAANDMIIEHCRAWARDAKAIRRVLELAATDPELAALTTRAESWRRDDIRALVERLRRASALRPGLTVAEATAALAMLTSFSTYDQLVIAGLRGARLARTLLHLARAMIENPG